MSRRIRSKAILKVAGLAVFAAMFCIGCGDKSTGGGEGIEQKGDTTYTITFNPTGGTVTPSSGTVIAEKRGHIIALDEALSLLPTPIRDGYNFIGWFSAETGGHDVTHAGSGDPIFRKNSTIYARWTLKTYKITFDAHGGEVTPAYDSTGDGWKLASLPTPTRDEYHTFYGWWTAPMNDAGDTVKVDHVYTANTTIYAHWIYTGEHYTITFDVNGEGGKVDPATEETDAGGILQDLPTPTRDGYAFIGWFADKTGGEAVTTETVFSADAAIYAQWIFITPEMYIVTFNAHGGTVTPASGTTDEDGELLTALPTPKREGYTFQGWFTEDAAVTASTVFTSNTTIHAIWAIIHYTITFNAAGGTVTPTVGATSANWEVGDLPTPTRDGYTFRGWYTAETGGTLVTTYMVLKGNTTIYAHWTSNNAYYTITFDPTGGTVTPECGTTGEGWRLAFLPTPMRDGYAFHGWYTAETGGTQVSEEYRGVGTVFETNTTIYAQWIPIVYGETVSYGGETYQVVVIGTQTWFVRNLNYAGGSGSEIGACYENSADSCAKYGRLYTWDEAMSACPTGWHLPSDDEWTTLTDFVGGEGVAGRELKLPSYWANYSGDDLGANDYGFSALPGGHSSNEHSSFRWWGISGLWWTSTDSNFTGRAWYREMQYYNWEVKKDMLNGGFKSWGYSVRCVKD